MSTHFTILNPKPVTEIISAMMELGLEVELVEDDYRIICHEQKVCFWMYHEGGFANGFARFGRNMDFIIWKVAHVLELRILDEYTIQDAEYAANKEFFNDDIGEYVSVDYEKLWDELSIVTSQSTGEMK